MTAQALPIQTPLVSWLLRRTATTGFRRVAPLSAAIASEIGNVRDENQDRAVIVKGCDSNGDDYYLAVVADGIGGMREGAFCAAAALGVFITVVDQQAQSKSLDSNAWMRAAISAANQNVFSSMHGDGGTTLVAALVRPNRETCWLSVGDSRVYLTHGHELIQLSTDDTIAGQLGKGDQATFEQSKLLQYVGMGADLEPHIGEFQALSDSRLLLATDGVHYLAKSPNWFEQVVSNAPDAGVCVKRMIDLAKWCGGTDNGTVAILPAHVPATLFGRGVGPNCLEIWDAFGELQILSVQVSPSIAMAPDAVISPKLPLRVASDSSSPKTVPQKTPRAKVGKKSKTSKARSSPKSQKEKDTDAPQLFVDFSTSPR